MRRSGADHGDEGCSLVRSAPGREYAYLLGQYLGDGCISSMGRGRWRLRIATCDAYPGIRAEVIDAIRAVLPEHAVGLVQCQGCTEVSAYSIHWPCLFPQVGPGVKHERPIRLQPWQTEFAIDQHPDAFVRGLIHSDGCRIANPVRRRLRSGTRTYSYSRYLFVNKSDDIRGLFLAGCAALGVEARPNNRWSISVARRASVEKLDSIVGPKQ